MDKLPLGIKTRIYQLDTIHGHTCLFCHWNTYLGKRSETSCCIWIRLISPSILYNYWTSAPRRCNCNCRITDRPTDQRKDKRGHTSRCDHPKEICYQRIPNEHHSWQTIGSQGERKVKILKIFRKKYPFYGTPCSFLTWKVLFETVPQTHNLQLSKLLSLFIGRFFWEV